MGLHGRRRGTADEHVVVGVDDRSGPIAQRRACDVGALAHACERAVEPGLAIRGHAAREVPAAAEHPAEGEVADHLRLLLRRVRRPALRVRADALREEQAQHDDRDQAHEAELDQPAALLLDARLHAAGFLLTVAVRLDGECE